MLSLIFSHVGSGVVGADAATATASDPPPTLPSRGLGAPSGAAPARAATASSCAMRASRRHSAGRRNGPAHTPTRAGVGVFCLCVFWFCNKLQINCRERLEPRNIKALLRRGTARLRLGHVVSAEADFYLALAVAPGGEQAWAALARLPVRWERRGWREMERGCARKNFGRRKKKRASSPAHTLRSSFFPTHPPNPTRPPLPKHTHPHAMVTEAPVRET